MPSSKSDTLALQWQAAALADESQRAMVLRRAFFDEGRALNGLVADAVVDSWRRCQKTGLQPDAQPVFQAVSRARNSYLSGRDHVLLKAAQQPFDELQASLAHSNCKVLLADRAGVLLRATPQRDSDSALLRAAIRPGVDLGEMLAGTNAPGLVARTGGACVIGAGEHFYELLGSMRCVAAPIRNRAGAVVAVLDLTIEHRAFGFDAAWLVGAYAGVIENNLRIAQTRQQVLLRLHPSPALLSGAAAGMAAIDEHGRLSWLNEVAAALLGVDAAAARLPHAEDALGLDLQQVLDLTVTRQPRALLLPSGLSVWVGAEFRKSGHPDDDVGGLAADGVRDAAAPLGAASSNAPLGASPVTETLGAGAAAGAAVGNPIPPGPMDPAAGDMAEVAAGAAGASLAQINRQLIDRSLALCGGNVSQAARMLGVSRGLLYRRLRDRPERSN